MTAWKADSRLSTVRTNRTHHQIFFAESSKKRKIKDDVWVFNIKQQVGQ